MSAPPKLPKPPGRKPRSKSAIVERCVVFSVVILAGTLVWLSVSRLIRIRAETRTLSGDIARLSGEIDLMRSQWPNARTQEISSGLPVAKAKLFEGPPAVADWMEEVRATAIPLDLQADFEFIAARTQALDHPVAVMQTRLNVAPSPAPDAPRSSYQRLLALGQQLAQHPRRLDIIELDVTGSSNSVGEASAVIDVWAENPVASAP